MQGSFSFRSHSRESTSYEMLKLDIFWHICGEKRRSFPHRLLAYLSLSIGIRSLAMLTEWQEPQCQKRLRLLAGFEHTEPEFGSGVVVAGLIVVALRFAATNAATAPATPGFRTHVDLFFLHITCTPMFTSWVEGKRCRLYTRKCGI